MKLVSHPEQQLQRKFDRPSDAASRVYGTFQNKSGGSRGGRGVEAAHEGEESGGVEVGVVSWGKRMPGF
jgi:hypothetical protein